jgi:NAD(P)-dependent dehydrogenase (short-subunit alcohol dehydrogenase family)
VPDGDVEVAALDLSDLSSVQQFAERFRAGHDGLDLLVNNAGVMAPPRQATTDGFELQFGTNHLGHFALTGRLLDLMAGRADARVVTVSSTAHRIGRINFVDLQSEAHYRRWRAYGQSKLANLLFALELERRLTAAGWTVSSLAAHPGLAATNLFSAGPRVVRSVLSVGTRFFAQSADMGALPTLYAATCPELAGGTYVGPGGRGERKGYPAVAVPSPAATDQYTASRLWEVSEELTGVRYHFG